MVADNCTDSTPDLARAAGVEVFASVDNAHKRGGALNQALAVLPAGPGRKRLRDGHGRRHGGDQGYLTSARRRFTDNRALMSVGGLFYGEDGAGLLGQYQRNEYTRYSRDIRRRRGRVFVLTGTASGVPLARALRTVADSRGTEDPGQARGRLRHGGADEDNELTLALRSLGGLMVSPPECTVVEVMPTWQALWHQRLRWQRGALENLGAYGGSRRRPPGTGSAAPGSGTGRSRC